MQSSERVANVNPWTTPSSAPKQGLGREPAFLWDLLSDNRGAEIVRRRSGHVVARQGEPVTHVVVAREGLTESFVRMPDQDDDRVLDMDFKGGVIGLVPALLEAPHPVSVRCVIPMTLLQVPVEVVVAMVRDDGALAELMGGLICMHSCRLVELLTELKLKSATQRLAGYLLSFNEGWGSDGSVTLPLRKKDLARCLGVTQQSLSRSLRRLQDRGCHVEGDTIVITDEEALRFFYDSRWQ